MRGVRVGVRVRVGAGVRDRGKGKGRGHIIIIYSSFPRFGIYKLKKIVVCSLQEFSHIRLYLKILNDVSLSYHHESISSCQITVIKHGWARLVLDYVSL